MYKLVIQFTMNKSVIILALLAFHLVIVMSANNCSSVNSSLCGTGSCLGFTMRNGTCSPNCSAYSYLYYSSSTDSCQLCQSLTSANCSSVCPGFYFTSIFGLGTCSPCLGSFGNCSKCTATGCIQCLFGFNLTSNNTCSNNSSESSSSSACNITNCDKCFSWGGCGQCSSGYILNVQNFTCTSANCTVGNCLICYQSRCELCENGYYLQYRACVPDCGDLCTGCSNKRVCLGCIANYLLDSTLNKCVPDCNFRFNGTCSVCSNLFICTTCKAGYVPAFQGTVCQKASDCKDQNCKKCTNSTCQVCKIGYKLLGNRSCSEDICFIENCLSCSSFSSCAICAAGYSLVSNSTCLPSCSGNVSNCIICSNSTSCLQCSVGYTLENGKCKLSCNISSCSVCLTASTCLTCILGYLPNSNFSACERRCADPSCSVCTNSTFCTTCRSGFIVNSRGRCVPPCMSGYSLSQNNTCQLCSFYLKNCQTCLFDNSSTIQCTQCVLGAYLNSGKCLVCNNSIPNCLFCSNSSSCNICSFGYKKQNGSCLLRNCSVLNCQMCQTNSTAVCSVCSKGFTIDSNGKCTYSCSLGQILIDGACSCPLGSYQNSNGSSCTSCSDTNCQICTSSGCTICRYGYYLSAGACVSCISNCLACVDETTCYTCIPPYVFNNESCTSFGGGMSTTVDSAGNIVSCPSGCDSCNVGTEDSRIICTILSAGYGQSGGNIIKCGPLCKNCSDNSSCLSCYSGYSLSGGACVNCTDIYADSCSTTNPSFSLSCVSGYTLVTDSNISTCQACSRNCYKCDVNGAGNCDSGQCFIGYVQLVGTKNCTQCFSNCPSCDSTDLSLCLSCGIRRYKDATTGMCLSCPAGCQNCNSSLVCLSCFKGYSMVGTICRAIPSWPCALGVNSVCTKCVQNFILQNKTCVYNSDCNSTSSCTSCSSGFYLSPVQSTTIGNCFACPNITNCLNCDPSNINSCLVCKKGSYVESGLCSACSSGCARCSSKFFCSQTKSGYYLLTDSDGSYNGQIGACTSPCSTCELSPNFCLSCTSGYSINGSMCFSNKVIIHSMTFKLPSVFNDNDTYEVAYGKVLRNIGYLKSLICSNLPQKITQGDPTCKQNFNFLSFRSGSVQVSSMLDTSGYTSGEEATTAVSSSNLIPGGTVISFSTAASGYKSSESSSSSNMSLVLGVSISLGGAMIIIIIGIIIYVNKKRRSQDIVPTACVSQQFNEFEVKTTES